MKKLILICIAFTLFSCKSTEKQSLKPAATNIVKGKYSGMVSQQYKAEGCNTVIIVSNQAEPLILIPVIGFDAKYNKDKIKISFDYLPLRMKNPEGCNIGIPAEISNLSLE